MTITLDEIVDHRDRLRREIVERECLLAAFDVLHGYMAKGHPPQSMELGALVATLGRPAPLLPLEPALLPTPEPAALPAPPPVPPYIHPELEAIGHCHGRNGLLVRWAIDRMTTDYSLHDIAALIRREGSWIRNAEISVVLTRMRTRGEIKEIRRGAGPIPALFRKPESASATTQGAESTPESAVAA